MASSQLPSHSGRVRFFVKILNSEIFFDFFFENTKKSKPKNRTRKSDDSTMCAAGFEDGLIRVFSISTETLKRLKTPEEVMDMDKDQLDLENIQMPTGEKSKSLIGHSGSVFGISISPRRDFLVSGGEDGTVRLWSLLGWFQTLLPKNFRHYFKLIHLKSI